MNKAARIRKRLILLIAFSIIWVFIGSLVIFHQEQVMGRTFSWNKISFVIPKSKDEKSTGNIKAEIAKDHSQSFILAVLDDNQREQLLAGHYSLLHINKEETGIPVFLCRSLSLRAPPLA